MVEVRTRRTNVSLGALIYLLIGIVVAWQRGYLTPSVLKVVLSAILAIVLWFLVLLGVDLHLR
jgi:hypothetical protein